MPQRMKCLSVFPNHGRRPIAAEAIGDQIDDWLKKVGKGILKKRLIDTLPTFSKTAITDSAEVICTPVAMSRAHGGMIKQRRTSPGNVLQQRHLAQVTHPSGQCRYRRAVVEIQRNKFMLIMRMGRHAAISQGHAMIGTYQNTRKLMAALPISFAVTAQHFAKASGAIAQTLRN